jgi:hypothetical protein
MTAVEVSIRRVPDLWSIDTSGIANGGRLVHSLTPALGIPRVE